MIRKYMKNLIVYRRRTFFVALFMLFASGLLLLSIFLVEWRDSFSNLYSILAMIIGLISFYLAGMLNGFPLSPIPIFSISWLFFAGFSGLRLKLLLLSEPLGKIGWISIFFVSFLFFLGSIIGIIINIKQHKDLTEEKEIILPKSLIYYYGPTILLVIGIISHIIEIILANEITFFSDNPALSRHFYSLPFLSFSASLGSLGIFLGFLSNRIYKDKIVLSLSLVYLIFLFFTSTRWGVFLILIIGLSFLSTKHLNQIEFLKKIILLVILVFIIFSIIQLNRVNIIEKEHIFISKGIYLRNGKLLIILEPIYYIGMSFRLMEKYILEYDAGCTKGQYTIYPVASLLQFDDKLKLINPIVILGYNTSAFMAKIYLDFGWIGVTLLTILWGILVNIFFEAAIFDEFSLWSKYLWGVSSISLILCFFCYLNAYSFWLIHFPLVLIIFQFIDASIGSKTQLKNYYIV